MFNFSNLKTLFKKSKESIIFTTIGFALLFVLSFFLHVEETSKWKSFVVLLEHIGVGVFAIGVLGLILERRHWVKTFQENLKAIVSTYDHFKNLSDHKREQILEELTTAIYEKNRVLTGENSFKDNFKKRLSMILNAPYRVNTEIQLIIKEHTDELLLITETLKWKCKENATCIPEIGWRPDQGEIVNFESTEITIAHNSHKFINGARTFTISNPHDNKEYRPESEKDNQLYGFKIDLEKINGLKDETEVTINVNYTVRYGRMFAWRSAFLTKGLKVKINFPNTLDFFAQPFISGVEDLGNPVVTSNGELEFTYDSHANDWYMPDEGIALQFLKKK